MSGLRSALEEWATQDLEDLHIDQLADDLVELETVSSMIDAERVRRLNRYEEISGPQSHGYASLTAFLIHRCRIAAGRARRLVGVAHSAKRCRRVHQAWVDQRVSTDQAHRLLEASDSAPEQFAPAEEELISIVEPLTPGDTRRALDYWRNTVLNPDNLDTKQDLRGVSLTKTMDGMGRVDGWLTPQALETLRTALDALMPPPSATDHRTARQRRHDALEDLARSFLDSGEGPIVGGDRPHISLICDLPALQGIAGGRHEMESGEVLTVDTLRRISCDASVSRIVLGPRSEIIDVGRRTRTIPAALRRAVIARDRHCSFRGCQRPARWCDVHHLRHWADHGPTDPENCVLLCRFHHTLVHKLEANRRGPPVRPQGRKQAVDLWAALLGSSP